jgi:hypothetical protein
MSGGLLDAIRTGSDALRNSLPLPPLLRIQVSWCCSRRPVIEVLGQPDKRRDQCEHSEQEHDQHIVAAPLAPARGHGRPGMSACLVKVDVHQLFLV